jgi:hypothetical protein
VSASPSILRLSTAVNHNQPKGNNMSESNTTATATTQLPGDASNLRVTIMGEGEAPQVEFLNVADSTQLSHSADVQQYPTSEEFTNEIESHNKAIADLQAKLDEKSFDPRTGQVKGHSYEGDARRILEAQLNNRKAALGYTNFNLQRAHQAAEGRAAKAAQLAKDNQPSEDTNSLHEQARRELLISQTAADLGIGRVKATALVDAELQRERVAARVRAMR